MDDRPPRIDYRKMVSSIFRRPKYDTDRNRKISLFDETGPKAEDGKKSVLRRVIPLFSARRNRRDAASPKSHAFANQRTPASMDGSSGHKRPAVPGLTARSVKRVRSGGPGKASRPLRKGGRGRPLQFLTKKALKVWDFFGGVPPEIIGLDIGSSAVKAVELRHTAKDVFMVNMAIEELPIPQAGSEQQGGASEPAQMQAHIDAALKKIFSNGKFTTKKVVAGVYGSNVQIECLSVPAAPEAELRKRIEWEAQDKFLLNLEEFTVDYISLSEPGPAATEQDILVVAAQKEQVKGELEFLRRAGLEPVSIEATALAPLIALEKKIKEYKDGVVMLLELGSAWTYLYILVGGQLKFNRSILLGQDAFTRAIAEYYNVGFKEAQELKFRYGVAGGEGEGGKVSQALAFIQERLVNDIEQSFKHFSYKVTKSAVTSINKVLLSGGGANCKGLDKFIAERLKVDVEAVDPMGDIAVDTQKMDVGAVKAAAPRLAAAVGLALRGG